MVNIMAELSHLVIPRPSSGTWVRADHDPFAQEIVERLTSEGIRAHMVEADEPPGRSNSKRQT